jgi:hypothetical protein
MDNHKLALVLVMAAVLGLGVLVVLLGGPAEAQTRPMVGSESARKLEFGSAHFGLDWNVLGSGGGEMSSTNFRLRSTIGQSAIGRQESAHFKNHAGYWQTFIFRVYIPLVLKVFS